MYRIRNKSRRSARTENVVSQLIACSIGVKSFTLQGMLYTV